MPRIVKQAAIDSLRSDKPEHVVGFLLKSLHHSLRQSIEEALRAQGLTMSFAHFATLFGLFSEPGITGAQLARRAMVSAQTMNSILRRLESEGLIERGPHPDSRRADSWSLAEEGEKQLARARVIGDTVFSRMLAALSADEVADLQTYLRRCIAALETSPAPRGTATTQAGSARVATRRSRQRALRPRTPA
jgi:DNA-binding MarR family transcriptional regulator